MKSIAPALAALFVAGTAAAAPPVNLAGTTWTMQINRDVEQLVITSQGGPGAPGASICQVIIGTIGIAPVRGWYCSATGKIHFRHQNINSGVTMRTFTGSVSDDVIGQPLYMAGTMTVDYATFGEYREYNFSGVR